MQQTMWYVRMVLVQHRRWCQGCMTTLQKLVANAMVRACTAVDHMDLKTASNLVGRLWLKPEPIHGVTKSKQTGEGAGSAWRTYRLTEYSRYIQHTSVYNPHNRFYLSGRHCMYSQLDIARRPLQVEQARPYVLLQHTWQFTAHAKQPRAGGPAKQ